MPPQDISRIANAIINLSRHFEVVGLKLPIAIVLAPGELPRLHELMLEGLALFLADEDTAGKTTIAGIEIREEPV